MYFIATKNQEIDETFEDKQEAIDFLKSLYNASEMEEIVDDGFYESDYPRTYENMIMWSVCKG